MNNGHYNVKIVSDLGLIRDCDVYSFFDSKVRIELRDEIIGVVSEEAEDAFEALCKIRLLLERDGYMILCNGARKDAYPSRLARQMGSGMRLYVFRQGVQARVEDLVDIFEPAELDQVGSVAEQRAMFESWIGSL